MLAISENIILKALSLDDVSNMFQVIDTERDYLRVWLPFVDLSLEERNTYDYVRMSLEDKDSPQFAIYEYKKFIGLIGFKDHDTFGKKIEIGYWLSQKAQKKGIMTKAVAALLQMAFEQMNVNRVQIKAAVGNLPSRRIPERFGFTLEGIERDGELLVDNQFTDLAIYSLLKSEYNSTPE